MALDEHGRISNRRDLASTIARIRELQGKQFGTHARDLSGQVDKPMRPGLTLEEAVELRALLARQRDLEREERESRSTSAGANPLSEEVTNPAAAVYEIPLHPAEPLPGAPGTPAAGTATPGTPTAPTTPAPPPPTSRAPTIPTVNNFPDGLGPGRPRPPAKPPGGGGGGAGDDPDDSDPGWDDVLWGLSSGMRGRLGKAGRTAARGIGGGRDYVKGSQKVRELEQDLAANPPAPPGGPGAGTPDPRLAELSKAKAQMAGGQEMMAQAAGQAIQMMVEKMVEGYKDMGKGAQKAFASGDAGGERIEGFGQFTKGFGAAMGPANPIGMGLETIGAFIEKTGEAAKALQDWVKGLHEANIRFADFSGSMASVKANQEIRQFELDRQRGDRRAGSAEELVKSMHDMNVQWARLEDNIANHLNKLGAHLADLVEYVLKILNKLLHSEEKELPGGGYLTDEMTYLRDLRMAEGFGRPPHMGMP